MDKIILADDDDLFGRLSGLSGKWVESFDRLDFTTLPGTLMGLFIMFLASSGIFSLLSVVVEEGFDLNREL